MKKGIAVSLLVVATILVGGLSMGCIDAPVVIPDEPEDNCGLTAKGLQVKADVAERQARGFVQYTGENMTGYIPPVVGEVTLIPEVWTSLPVISYCRCFASIPENVAGFDTPMERAYIYQAMLNDKMDSIGTITGGQYVRSGQKEAYISMYQRYYQTLQDKYQRMYCGVGNRVLTDGNFSIETGNSTGNGSA